MGSARLWSLWDMLQAVDPDGIVKSISLLASESKRLAISHGHAVRNGTEMLGAQTDALTFCIWASDKIAASADNLGMVGVGKSAARLRGWLVEALQRSGHLRTDAVDQLAGGMSQLIVAFGDELDGRRIFVMTPQYAKYYEHSEPLFGTAVFDAFPDAILDIESAGKCLSLGCATACVMHLMRVLEVGLKAVAKEFGIENKNDWGTYIREIEKELERREATAGKRTADEQFYADACTQFGNLKVAYRNPTMHVANDYSDERAEEILIATRAFMRHLAPRFSDVA